MGEALPYTQKELEAALDRSVFKGFERLDEQHAILVFEQQRITYELELRVECTDVGTDAEDDKYTLIRYLRERT